MGFLRRLFKGKDERDAAADPHGIYLFVACDRCGTHVRLRADKQYELNRGESGYVWHKTVVDSRCFRPMPTVVHFDLDYNVVGAEIEGGRYVTKEAYEAWLTPPPPDRESNEEHDAGAMRQEEEE